MGGKIDLDVATRMYREEHKTHREIAAYFGCTYQAVHDALTRYGVSRVPADEKWKKKLEELPSQLYTREELAQHLGCSVCYISALSKIMSLPLKARDADLMIQLEQLYVNEEKSLEQCAALLGYSRGWVAKKVQQYNLTMKRKALHGRKWIRPDLRREAQP